MNKVAIGAAAITTLFASHAVAADMAVKAPPAAPPPGFSWNGCYVGGQTGYGWGRNRNDFGSAVDFGTDDDPGESFADFNHNTKGWLGGAQWGCNSQIAPNWVFGIEDEFFWTGMKGTVSYPEDEAGSGGTLPDGNHTALQSKNLWDTTLALRLGYSVDRSLFYGKVGAAWGRFEYDETHDDFPTRHACPHSCTAVQKQTEAGLLLGAGWEYAFLRQLEF
jgi:outer membrane immunogenic protein